MRISDCKLQFCALFFHFCRCVASLVFFGFLLYISDIEGDPYLNLVIMFVVSDVPGTILSWIVIQK